MEEVNKNSSLNYFKKKMRTAAYIRVSTQLDGQKESLEEQRKYYEKKICDNPNWELIEIYIDDGISGLGVSNRFGFQRMVKDVLKGKVDFILTKSISRFSRNTVDLLNYIKIFKNNGCAIYFEEENINTFEMKGELLITILGSIYEQESENISSHVKMSIEMKMRKGELVGCKACYGYNLDKKNNRLNINVEESKIVKEIFSLFLKGYSEYQIASYLTMKKVKTKKGLSNWDSSTIKYILKNEKYVGDLLQGKNFRDFIVTKNRKINNGEKDMFYVKNHHEEIVSRETWNSVQSIIKKGDRQNNQRNRIILSKYIICGYCNSYYNHVNSYKPKYVCSNKALGLCNISKYIPSDLIYKVFIDVINRLKDYLLKRIIDKHYDLLYIRKTIGVYLNDKKLKEFDFSLFKKIIRTFIVGNDKDPYNIRIILNNELIIADFPKDRIDLRKNNSLILFKYNYKYDLKTYENTKKSKKLLHINKIKVSVEVMNDL